MSLKLTCLRTLVLTFIIVILGIAPLTARSQADSDDTLQQRKAIAFLLGWDSKLLIVERTRAGRQQYLSNIKQQLHELGLVLKHPTEYYFKYPTKDAGLRAQAFSEEAMAQLTTSNPEVANHFAVAHNLLLTISHRETPVAARRAEIAELVAFLDIPDDLKKMPTEDLLGWVGEIHEYFLSTSNRDTKQGLPHPETNIFENPAIKRIFQACNAAANTLPSKCSKEDAKFTIRSSSVVCHWECGRTGSRHQPQHGPWKLMRADVKTGEDAP